MMDFTLLKTKLYRPPLRPELVSRPQLVKRLNEGLNSKLIVISAPAGYGKTTLVSAWASQYECPVAWLSLDEEDNDPVHFLSYIVSAVQTIKPGLGQEILSVLQSAQPPAITNLLPVLINQLDDIQVQFMLVLDDYHLIVSPEIHKAIIFIIDHQPPRMKLLLATRVDPPLPLPLLRGRGHLTELRQADLRFSEDETIAFLKKDAGIELASQEVNTLLNRTEGWIAGIQMAALSMRNKKDISSFIEGFGGSHEYIVDYFTSEILNNLSETTKSFLLKTSFLDQLCGSLCDDVSGQSGGQQTLEELHEANLFLVPLDDDHNWYRYHQLFSDLLSKSLQHYYPLEVPGLHLRASHWFEKHEYPHQAVEHAFLARDTPRVARLLEDVAEPALGRGEHLWLLKWIEKLPEEQLEEHLRLSIIKATIFTSIGTLQKAEAALQKIEAYTSAHPTTISNFDYVIVRVIALHAMIAIQRGDVDRARKNALLALEKLPEGTQHEASWRADVLLALGLSNFASGDLIEARQNLDKSIGESKLAGDPYTFLFVTAYLIDVLWSQGDLNEAVERCQAGLKFIDEHHLGWAPMSGEVLVRWSLLLCERLQLSQAEEFLNRGTELIRIGGVPWSLAWAHHMRMFLLIAQGALPEAETAAQEADQLLQITELPTRVSSGISALKELVWIRLGKLDQTEQFLRKRGIWIGSEIRYPYHREYQALAALLVAEGDVDNAQILLDNLIDWAEATKQYRILICARVLYSLACAAQKDMQKAMQSLGKAMDLAEPEGYFLAILEVGRSIIPVLYEAIQKGVRPEFSTRLLEGILETYPNALAASDVKKRQPGILTPLRGREVEVLKLVAEGHTNKEVALELHISLRTVKFHMTSIMTKLGVDNRMSAVTKAKMLGVIK